MKKARKKALLIAEAAAEDAMRQAYTLARKCAPDNLELLILGDTIADALDMIEFSLGHIIDGPA